LRNIEQVGPGMAQTIPADRFRTIIRALEKRPGADLLAAPRVTTLSGRQARIEVTSVKEIVTSAVISTDPANKSKASFIISALSTGPAVDVFPQVATDGKTIQLTVIPSWTEFLGYDQPAPFVADGIFAGNKLGRPLEVQRPLPHFQVRQTRVTADIRDAETLVIRGFGSFQEAAKKPSWGRSAKAASTPKRELIIFVTPVIINPAGNPRHSE
jgi:general secretion pathway protein D